MRRKNTRLSVAIIATVSALALAACGDDDDGSGDESISRADYIAQSNSICRGTAKSAERIYSDVFGNRPPNAAHSQEFLTQLLPVFEGGVEQRGEIPAPEGDEAEVEAINAAGQEAAAGFREAAASTASATKLMRGQTPDPAAEYDRLSGAYGIAQCAGRD
jgi:hypothetical protein